MKIHFITLNSKSKLHHTHKVCCTCKLQYTHCFFWAKTAKRIFICFFIFHHCPKEWMYSVLLFLLLAWVDLGSKMEPCATKINSWKSLLLLEKALCLSLYVCISLCLSVSLLLKIVSYVQTGSASTWWILLVYLRALSSNR